MNLTEAALNILNTHPRRIWVEGDGRVYRDGPGNSQRIEMSSLDLIRLIHLARDVGDRIVSVLL